MRAVLERDYLAEAIRPRAFWARAAPGAFAAATLVILVASATVRGESLDVAGAAAFRLVTRAVLLFLGVVTPLLLVGSLLAERRNRTLEILLASPVGPRGAAAGAFVARLGTALGWAASAIPPLAVAVLFGGTPWRALVNTSFGILAAGVECAAWGILVSALSRRMATAALLAYLLPWLHAWAAESALDGNFGGGATILFAATGPAAALDLAGWDAAAAGRAWGFLLRWPGLFQAAAAALFAWVAVRIAASALARESEPAGGGFQLRIPRSAADSRLRRRLTGDNPVAWKDSLLLNSAWSRPLFYGVLGVLLLGEGVLLVLAARGEWRPANDFAWLGAACAVMMTLAAVQGAAAMSHEKGQGTFELLRISLLTPREIATGKIVGTLLGMGILLLVPAVHVLLTVLGGLHRPEAALLALVALIVLTVHAAIHGLTWGAIARSPGAALAGAASMALFSLSGCSGFCLLPFLLAGFQVLKRGDASPFLEVIVVPAILGGSPVMLLGSLLPLLDEGWSVGPGTALRWGLGGGLGLFSLGVAAIYIVYRWRNLPSVLDREITRLSEGTDRLHASRDFRVHPSGTPGARP